MVNILRDGSGQTLWINCPVDMCISMVYRKHLKLGFKVKQSNISEVTIFLPLNSSMVIEH